MALIGVLKKCHESEWAAPTFIQPKKMGNVRVLTDFCQLNKFLKRRPFPLPKNSDLLQKLQGFKYATAIDLSMGLVLPHSTGSSVTKIVYNDSPMGKIPVPKTAYGHKQ